MMMKPMIAVAAVAALLTGTAAVNKKVFGEWETKSSTYITPEMQDIFDDATDELIGVDYEAVELIETQIVNGTNYKFLAEKQAVYPGAEKENVIVTVYKDLAGNVSVIDITAE